MSDALLKTEHLDGINDQKAALSRAVELLTSGEIVAFPTETVYGLGARVYDPVQIAKIFAAKQRPQDNPLIVHISSLEQIPDIVAQSHPKLERLVQHFFPGPLSLVMKRSQRVPSLVSAGLDSVAFRMPSHDLARALIEAVGEPLVAPSANRSGRPSPTKAEHVHKDLDGRIAAVLDGGSCTIGLESTVISLLEPQIRLLRPGSITQAQLEDVLGEKLVLSTSSDQDARHSPGMRHRHYAPSIPVVLVENLSTISDETKKRRLILSTEHIQGTLHGHILKDSNFYDELRWAEDHGYEEIAIFLTEDLEANTALFNRILKAASGV